MSQSKYQLTSEQLTLFEELHRSRIETYEKLKEDDFNAVFDGVIYKYSEPAHFVYELLQNADDAGASWVEININPHQLFFKHNGSKHFNITKRGAKPLGDINAITAIGNSSKKSLQNKIGKFGVGFKSVFQYTSVPEIYDDTFKFKIENYIIPTLIENDHPDRKDGETLIVLPFNDKDVYPVIIKRLKNLQNPILFLDHLTRIEIRVNEDDNKPCVIMSYEMNLEDSIDCDRNVKLEKYSLKEPRGTKKILLFSKFVTTEKDKEKIENNKICVGYYYDEKTGRISMNSNQKIYCFFPTKESFKTCFITHAPFLLTDSRQDLKPGEKHNTQLVNHLSKLAAKTLVYLRDYGRKRLHKLLVDENLCTIVPKYVRDTNDELEEVFEKPMQDAFRDVISKEAVFLSRDGLYLKSGQAFVGKPQELVELLSGNQLAALTGVATADFLKPELSKAIEKQEGDLKLRAFVRSYDSASFARAITASFMAQQEMKWVLRFYHFLRFNAVKLWKMQTGCSMDSVPFRTAPIVKIQSGEWVAAYNKDRLAKVFLPLTKGASSSYCFVHQDYYADEDAKLFFDDFEIKEPDSFDYVNKEILPRYEGDNMPDYSEFSVSDLKEIYGCYSKIKGSEREDDLIGRLAGKFCLMGTDGRFHVTEDLFFYNDNIEEYIKNSELSVWDENYYASIIKKRNYNDLRNFLSLLGVRKHPAVIAVKRDNVADLCRGVRSKISNSAENTDYIIHDYELQCFKKIVKSHRMTKSISLYLWNEVLTDLDISKYSNCEISYKRKRARVTRDVESHDSTFVYLLKNESWVYDSSGVKRLVKDLYLEDIAKEYNINNSIASWLGIKKKERSILELGGTKEQQKTLDFGRRVKEIFGDDVSETELIELARERKAKKALEHRTSEPEHKNSELQAEESTLSVLKEEWQRKAAKEVKKPKSASLTRRVSDNVTLSNSQSNSKSQQFFDEANTSVPDVSNDMTDSTTKRRLKEKCTDAQKSAQNANDQAEYFELLQQTEKFTFNWFRILMELMHNGKTGFNQREIRVDFSEWKLINNDNLLRLSNPSQQLPTWMADADSIDITALSPKSSDKVEGKLVRCDDYSIDLYIELTKDLNSILKRASKMRLIAEESASFIDAFQTKFLNLGLEDDFNLSQNLPKDITFIYGPPGTGKTTKVVQMVREILNNAKRETSILILTPTNKAADVIAEKMLCDDVCRGHLTRFGATESISLIAEDGVVGTRDTTLMKASGHDIIVTTAARYAYDYVQPNDSLICDYPWDDIIIDEASMMDILTASFILFKGKDSKIIVSGDPMQIQPVSQNGMPSYSIYDLVGLHGLADAVRGYDRYPVIALTEQHRSIPSIGDAVSRFAYNGLVNADRNRAPQKPLELDGISVNDINFIGYDVADFDLVRELSAVGGSAFQLYAAIFTYNMAGYMVRQITTKYPHQNYSIGIVCPYKAEADAIKQMLDSRSISNEHCKVMCGTVHGFQGDECDIMLVVLNPPASCGRDSHINNKNIINVAMSRARDYLFFIVPNGQQKGFTMKNDLGKLMGISQRNVMNSSKIEEIMFGSSDYICSNTHVCCHMPINVYCDDMAKYEVRMSDNALDIRINYDGELF